MKSSQWPGYSKCQCVPQYSADEELSRERVAAARGIWEWRMCREKSVSSSRTRAVVWGWRGTLGC
jgi:hypothetical protein